MGWWDNRGRIWGDGPADVLDIALREIREQFKTQFGREPTEDELEYGFRFSTRTHCNICDFMRETNGQQ